eukprot:CFRG7546T1
MADRQGQGQYPSDFYRKTSMPNNRDSRRDAPYNESHRTPNEGNRGLNSGGHRDERGRGRGRGNGRGGVGIVSGERRDSVRTGDERRESRFSRDSNSNRGADPQLNRDYSNRGRGRGGGGVSGADRGRVNERSRGRERTVSMDGGDTGADACRLFVGSIDHTVQKKDIWDMCLAYGRVLEVVMHDCYAFVQFDSAKAVTQAIERGNGRFLGQCRIDLQLSRAAKRKSRPNISTDSIKPRDEDSRRFNRGPAGRLPSKASNLRRSRSRSPFQQRRSSRLGSIEDSRRDGRFGRSDRDHSYERSNGYHTASRGSSLDRTRSLPLGRDQPPTSRNEKGWTQIDDRSHGDGRYSQSNSHRTPEQPLRRSPTQSLECLVIALYPQQSEYADYVMKNIKTRGINCDLKVTVPDQPIKAFLEELRTKGVPVAVIVNQRDEASRLLSVNLLCKTPPRDLRAMPLEEGIKLIVDELRRPQTRNDGQGAGSGVLTSRMDYPPQQRDANLDRRDTAQQHPRNSDEENDIILRQRRLQESILDILKDAGQEPSSQYSNQTPRPPQYHQQQPPPVNGPPPANGPPQGHTANQGRPGPGANAYPPSVVRGGGGPMPGNANGAHYPHQETQPPPFQQTLPPQQHTHQPEQMTRQFQTPVPSQSQNQMPSQQPLPIQTPTRLTNRHPGSHAPQSYMSNETSPIRHPPPQTLQQGMRNAGGNQQQSQPTFQTHSRAHPPQNRQHKRPPFDQQSLPQHSQHPQHPQPSHQNQYFPPPQQVHQHSHSQQPPHVQEGPGSMPPQTNNINNPPNRTYVSEQPKPSLDKAFNDLLMLQRTNPALFAGKR